MMVLIIRIYAIEELNLKVDFAQIVGEILPDFLLLHS